LVGKNRIRAVTKWAAVPVGLVLSGVLVLGFSHSAFTASTTNANNSWSTGSLDIGTNLTQTMFSHSANTYKNDRDQLMVPGKVITSGVTVTYTGNVKGDVRVYSSAIADKTLSDKLNLKITDNASNTLFNNTLSNFSLLGGWSGSSATSWKPTTSGAQKTYTFTVTAAADAPGDATVGAVTFTWEARAIP